jgi:hypothetical protein
VRHGDPTEIGCTDRARLGRRQTLPGLVVVWASSTPVPISSLCAVHHPAKESSAFSGLVITAESRFIRESRNSGHSCSAMVRPRPPGCALCSERFKVSREGPASPGRSTTIHPMQPACNPPAPRNAPALGSFRGGGPTQPPFRGIADDWRLSGRLSSRNEIQLLARALAFWATNSTLVSTPSLAGELGQLLQWDRASLSRSG